MQPSSADVHKHLKLCKRRDWLKFVQVDEFGPIMHMKAIKLPILLHRHLPQCSTSDPHNECYCTILDVSDPWEVQYIGQNWPPTTQGNCSLLFGKCFETIWNSSTLRFWRESESICRQTDKASGTKRDSSSTSCLKLWSSMQISHLLLTIDKYVEHLRASISAHHMIFSSLA